MSHGDLDDGLDFEASRGSAASCAVNLLALPLVFEPEAYHRRVSLHDVEQPLRTCRMPFVMRRRTYANVRIELVVALG